MGKIGLAGALTHTGWRAAWGGPLHLLKGLLVAMQMGLRGEQRGQEKEALRRGSSSGGPGRTRVQQVWLLACSLSGHPHPSKPKCRPLTASAPYWWLSRGVAVCKSTLKLRQDYFRTGSQKRALPLQNNALGMTL